MHQNETKMKPEGRHRGAPRLFFIPGGQILFQGPTDSTPDSDFRDDFVVHVLHFLYGCSERHMHTRLVESGLFDLVSCVHVWFTMSAVTLASFCWPFVVL